jgi:hypothetical protein
MPPACWRSPEQIAQLAIEHSQVTLVNEAHNGLRRCIRTREIGLRIVRQAHAAGVRHLAMEALYPHAIADIANRTRQLPDHTGYLQQPEMREMISRALDLGWTLVPYEANLDQRPIDLTPLSEEETNWREREQATNLARAIEALPDTARLLVWCGNHHLAKHASDGWKPMGSQLHALTGIDPFAIDQTLTVNFGDGFRSLAASWADAFAATLEAMGGTAGFLTEEAPPDWDDHELADAFLLSTDNELS